MEYIEEKLLNTREKFESLRNFYWSKIERECFNCGNTDKSMHLHHIVPLGLGGTNRWRNISCLCEDCHSIVHDSERLRNHAYIVSVGREKMKEKGLWSAGKICYGYQKGDTKGKIIINDEEAEVVKLIYKWRFINEISTTQIIKLLSALSIPSKTNSNWVPSRIKELLESNTYFGDENNGVKFPRILSEDMRELRKKFNDKYFDTNKKRFNFKSKCSIEYDDVEFSTKNNNPVILKNNNSKLNDTSKKDKTISA